MLEYYAQIKCAHVLTVVASGALFLLRGLLVAVGHGRRALAPMPRFLSYTIDSALLATALALLWILPFATFSNGWLLAKLLLLPVYIALGWLALRSVPRSGRQIACYAAALLAFAAMYGIARAHDPLGPLRLFTGS